MSLIHRAILLFQILTTAIILIASVAPYTGLFSTDLILPRISDLGLTDYLIYGISVVFLASYTGMLFYLKWSRFLHVCAIIVSSILSYFYSSICFQCISSVVIFYVSIFDGALIAINYLTSITSRFKGR